MVNFNVKVTLGNSRLNFKWTNCCLPPDNLSPLELFGQFIHSDVIEMFVNCTNIYAVSKNRRSDAKEIPGVL
jgi:hypothetical protein